MAILEGGRRIQSETVANAVCHERVVQGCLQTTAEAFVERPPFVNDTVGQMCCSRFDPPLCFLMTRKHLSPPPQIVELP